MKRLFAIAACSLPFIVSPALHAQTTAPAAGGSSASEGSAAPAPTTPPSTSSPAGTPTAPTNSTAPAAGMGATGASESADTTQAISGWSVKEKIIGKDVHNENDEKVGEITDVILANDGKAVYYVIGAGGFLGMGSHDVAIPFDKVQQGDDKLTLTGYTKDQLKALPKVEVAK